LSHIRLHLILYVKGRGKSRQITQEENCFRRSMKLTKKGCDNPEQNPSLPMPIDYVNADFH